mmetsp:Transcript_15886/g.24465  ORF Transcript_15886/g.24465 Transcript_15886/m.24465 type:complete len:123 (+) Transcript_15886:397-765(+)
MVNRITLCKFRATVPDIMKIETQVTIVNLESVGCLRFNRKLTNLLLLAYPSSVQGSVSVLQKNLVEAELSEGKNQDLSKSTMMKSVLMKGKSASVRKTMECHQSSVAIIYLSRDARILATAS